MLTMSRRMRATITVPLSSRAREAGGWRATGCIVTIVVRTRSKIKNRSLSEILKASRNCLRSEAEVGFTLTDNEEGLQWSAH